MKFQKQILGQMERCYAVSVMEYKNHPYVFFATEGKNGGCIAFEAEKWENSSSVWETPGGTMSMVPLSGERGFLAIQKFYRLYEWEEAELVWCYPAGDGGWRVKELFTLPYIHRFDVLKRDGKEYLICCTLAAHKKERADWSQPGAVYTAELPGDLNTPFTLKKLELDIYQNHGFVKKEADGYDIAFVGGREGIFRITPPGKDHAGWQTEQIFYAPVSDMDWIDIDGDGEPELATIEEFHGCYYRIYKKREDGYRLVFQHPEETEFYHVVKSGTLCGRPVFVGGCRRGKQQLFVVECTEGKFTVHTADEGVGPSNAVIYHGAEYDYICSANRETGEAAVYKVTEG
ncbi:MAG: hypothetical protein Q4C91_01990 [Eubacteriales bacterium]|nr:hypothetical protein [Eubacteriales bacterium]